MTLTLGEIVVLLLCLAAVIYVFSGIRVRELALSAARRACEQDSVQLLDQSVSVSRVSLSRDASGRWRMWRQFRFEYSVDGEQRRQGHVIMLGYRIQGLVMGEHTLH